jgi:uncharacterized protein with GYD domain
MAHFVVLGQLTAQGIGTYKDSTNRANAASQAAASMGGRLVDIYWTMGKYDFVAIFEMPDDETMTALLYRLGSQGNVSTATMRAFNRAEMETVLAKAGG